MELNTITIGLGALISLATGLIGAAGFWFKIKNHVEIIEVKLGSIEKDSCDLKKDTEKDQDIIHKRIANLKKEVEKNREKNDEALSDLTQKMADMELRIIKAINAAKK